MERIALHAVSRGIGKGAARKARSNGFIPAILYGKKMNPQALSINAKDFAKATKASPDLTAIINLSIEGGEEAIALVRDYQADIFKRHITHLDLQAIDMNEKIDLEIPITLIGIPAGVKDEGGVLEQLRRKIHIRVLPKHIPSHIDVDVSSLKIGQSIHADEVPLPEGVEFPHASNYTIVTVVPPAKEEVVAAPVAAPVEGAVAAEGAAPADAAAAGSEKKTDDKKKEEKKGEK